LLLGVFYLALCSAQFPYVYEAFLNGTNVVPAQNVTSNSTGHGYVILNNNLIQILCTIDVDTVPSPTLAHIHIGPTTVSGPVCFNLTSYLPEFTLAGPLTNTDSQLFGTPFSQFLANLTNGDTYLNIHNVPYPNGAARGQLYLSQNFFTAVVNTSNEVTQCNGTFVAGYASILINPQHTRVTVTVILTTNSTFTPTLAYIQIGSTTTNGIIAVNLTNYLPLPINATFDISPAQLLNNVTQAEFATQLLAGHVYVNVYSAICPAGHARGQIYPQVAPIIGTSTTTGGSTTGSTTGGSTTGSTGSVTSGSSETSSTGSPGSASSLNSWIAFL